MFTIVPLFASIIGIVFIPKIIQIAIYSFNPIGWEIVPNANPTSFIHDPNNILVRFMNILWFIFLGWEFFLMHLVFAIVQALTIFGIGNAIRHLHIAKATIFPFGKHIQRTPIPIRPSRNIGQNIGHNGLNMGVQRQQPDVDMVHMDTIPPPTYV